MNVAGKRAVVTGGGRGIGAALAVALRGAGANVMTADLEGADIRCDVAVEEDLRRLIEQAGEIDLFFSNAGVATMGGPETPDAKWQRHWDVNVMAHVRAARLLLPAWLERGSGYFIQTVSAAGLLTMIGASAYSVTKHAALAFAEWMSITYHSRGIRVSAICPLGVKTAMYDKAVAAGLTFLAEGAVNVEEVADAALAGIAEERFLILPQPEAAEFYRRRATDPERWLESMREMQSLFP